MIELCKELIALLKGLRPTQDGVSGIGTATLHRQGTLANITVYTYFGDKNIINPELFGSQLGAVVCAQNSETGEYFFDGFKEQQNILLQTRPDKKAWNEKLVFAMQAENSLYYYTEMFLNWIKQWDAIMQPRQ